MSKKAIELPYVSIIVPVLNSEKTIKVLLESLINLDYDKKKLEIIMVDGGSKDSTKEIIQNFSVNLIIEKKKGLNVARNTGFKISTGKIILFTDSDCVIPENWVKNMVKHFLNPKVGCVGGSILRYKNSFLSRYADESIMPVLRRFKKFEMLNNVELFSRYPAGCNMAFRRRAIEKVGGFNEEIIYGFDEDELVERVCNAGYKLILDPDTIVKHQHRPNLKSLLKQNYNYGKGGTIMMKKTNFKGKFSKWILASQLLFIFFVILNSAFFYLFLFISPLFLLIIFMLVPFPVILLIFFYSYKALKKKEYIIPFTYPLIDILRLFAFFMGELYGYKE
jgi:cellulose synthase/poly-beta-1,6-N-acetylglucosamine synthase-like glycosyltransferase